MKINDILEDAKIDDAIAFLSCYVPMIYSDVNINTKINVRKIDKLIKQGPETYLDSICIKACQELWKKNIYVLDSIKFHNDTYLILDTLDKNNQEIFEYKRKNNAQNYCKDIGNAKYFGIRVNNCLAKTQEEIEIEFYNLVSCFEMQDVQRGYLNEKTFLMNICDCEKVEGIKEYEENNPKIVFDSQKMEKSFKEYLIETGYDRLYIEDEHRIYLNDYYYNSHQNYLNNNT